MSDSFKGFIHLCFLWLLSDHSVSSTLYRPSLDREYFAVSKSENETVFCIFAIRILSEPLLSLEIDQELPSIGERKSIFSTMKFQFRLGYSL